MIRRLALILSVAAAVFGQTVPNRYIVELAGDLAAVAVAKQGSRFAAREAGFAARRASVRQGQIDVRRGVAEHGGTVLESPVAYHSRLCYRPRGSVLEIRRGSLLASAQVTT